MRDWWGVTCVPNRDRTWYIWGDFCEGEGVYQHSTTEAWGPLGRTAPMHAAREPLGSEQAPYRWRRDAERRVRATYPRDNHGTYAGMVDRAPHTPPVHPALCRTDSRTPWRCCQGPPPSERTPVNIVNRHLGRRTARAIASFCFTRSSAAQGCGVDPECIPTLDAMRAKALHHIRNSLLRDTAFPTSGVGLDEEAAAMLENAIWRQQLICDLN